jgi:RNA methyltransferase, TrmH family
VPAGDLLASARRVVLLQGVQDPGNVGTVIRSAHAFEAGVALSRGCADLYNPKTVRATMGSIFHAPVTREQDSLDFLRRAEDAGFATVAAVPESGSELRSLPAGRLVVVVGAEGPGLPEEVVEACQLRATIPSRTASLNAAIAASILLYKAYMRVLP